MDLPGSFPYIRPIQRQVRCLPSRTADLFNFRCASPNRKGLATSLSGAWPTIPSTPSPIRPASRRRRRCSTSSIGHRSACFAKTCLSFFSTRPATARRSLSCISLASSSAALKSSDGRRSTKAGFIVSVEGVVDAFVSSPEAAEFLGKTAAPASAYFSDMLKDLKQRR